MPELPRILVPMDFSEASEDALDAALDVARSHPGMEIVLLHVRPVRMESFSGGVHAAVVRPEDAEAALRKRFEERVVRPSFKGGGAVHAVFAVKSGHPASVILHEADELRAGMIVMGAHGRRCGGAAGVLGATAEHVARNARCPVMLCRGAVKRPFAEAAGAR